MIRSLLSSGGATKCRTIDKLDIFGDGSCKALYRFDGNANDESGNHNGTETNVTYGGGVYERCAVFNGSSSKVLSSSITSLSVNFSISLWANKTMSGNQMLVELDSITLLHIDSSSKVSYYDGAYRTFNFIPTLGTLYHLCLIVNGTLASLYVNGTLHSSIACANKTSIANTTASIGHSFANNTLWFNGKIDQVRIFNRAITAPEVAILYAECEPTSIIDNINPFEDGSLKALYKFDNDATDATGVYNGTPTNVTYASGKFGNCAVFNGSSSKVELGTFAVSAVSLWFNVSQTTQSQIGTLYEGRKTGCAGFGAVIHGNQLSVYGTATINIPFTTTNTWVHLVVQHNGTNLMVYINGLLVNSTIASLSTIVGNHAIGWSALTYYLNGSIDQVRIFDKALTPLEVASLYNETTPMEEPMSVQVDPFKDGSGKALYRLEGNALDESGNYNGTPANLTYGLGRFGRCGLFNGSNSVVTNAKTTQGSFSWSSWITPSSVASSQSAVGAIFGATSHQWQIGCSAGNIIIKTYDGTERKKEVSGTNGQTYHCVLTYDGTSFRGFVNGVEIGTAVACAVNTQTSTMEIGRIYSSYYWNGKIDQVRIFNKALTQSEVTALYNEI